MTLQGQVKVKTSLGGSVNIAPTRTEIVDNLKTENPNKALSANQGVVLKGMVDSLEEAVQGIIDEMNYKNIDITGFSCPGAGTYEMGQSVAAPTVSWSLNKEPASQSLNGEALGVDVRSKAYSGNITSNKTYTLNVTGQKGETDSASGSFTFYNGVYYGSMVAGSAINNAAILALTKKLQSGRSVSFRVSSNRPVYACPTRYGTPKFTIGGFEYEWDNVATFDFTNASGYVESYSVWMHTQNVSDSVTINVT